MKVLLLLLLAITIIIFACKNGKEHSAKDNLATRVTPLTVDSSDTHEALQEISRLRVDSLWLEVSKFYKAPKHRRFQRSNFIQYMLRNGFEMDSSNSDCLLTRQFPKTFITIELKGSTVDTLNILSQFKDYKGASYTTMISRWKY